MCASGSLAAVRECASSWRAPGDNRVSSWQQETIPDPSTEERQIRPMDQWTAEGQVMGVGG